MDEGRILFTSFDPGEEDAGFIKMNDSIGGIDQIRERSKAGYLIRTRADIPVREAKSGDTTRREAALNSGAHYISTDYPEMSPFGSDRKSTRLNSSHVAISYAVFCMK